MTVPPLLQVRDLRVRFRAPSGLVTALRGLDLDLDAGELLVVVGESGSGKTVLATAILGLLPPNAEVTGSIRLAGRELVGARERQLRRARRELIGVVPQGAATALNPVRRIGRQADELARVRGLDRGEGRRRVDEELARYDLDVDRVRRAYPHQLSGGMQQRVLLALARVADPALVLADEPTHGLDADLVDVTARRLSTLREAGQALLVITHDLRLAERLGGRAAVLYGAELLELRATSALFAAPTHPYTAGLLGAMPEHGAVPIPGGPPDLTDLPAGCVFAPRCPWSREGCATVRPATEPVDGGRVRCPYHAEVLETARG
jgi:peptide/nickel transport system ATP-binding protein